MSKRIYTFILILLILLCFNFSVLSLDLEPADYTYIVKAGDSLYLISRKFNVSIEAIKRLNSLNSDIIYIDQKLNIPSTEPADSHLVKRGDSLYKLALKYNTTIQKIKELNNLQSDIIYIGQILAIPSPDENFVDISGRVTISNKTGKSALSSQDVINTEMVSSLGTIGDNSAEYEETEIIVKYKPFITGQSVNEIEKENGLSVMGEIESDKGKIIRYKIPEEKEIDSMMEYYGQLEQVEWVEPNYIYYPAEIPTDPYYNYHQWNLVNSNLEAAWDVEKGSKAVTVAVLDTGVIPDHPDLRANLLQGADFVGGERNYPVSSYNISDYDPTDETPLVKGGSHGTHVAGIIGAVTDNYKGIAGINWAVNILPVRVLKKSGGTSWDIAEGIYYVIDQNAQVINLSLGGNSYSHLQEEAIKTAYKKGIITVAAAGNESSTVYYPAALPEVIAVGAVAKDNTLTYYSNRGPEIDLVAPGGIHGNSIYSTWGYYDQGTTVSSYGGMIGTSMATPHVSGAAALLIAGGVNGPENIRSRLTASARDLGQRGKDDLYGYGLLDVYGALKYKKLAEPKVFAATKREGVYRLKSDIVKADEKGYFRLDKVKSGELHIISWLDVNENEIIDKGDYYGETDLLQITASLKDVDIVLNYISGNTENIRVLREDINKT